MKAQEATGGDVWVYLDDINVEGKWTIAGQDCSNVGQGGSKECASLNQWSPNEPNNAGGEDCGELGTTGLLNGIRCDDTNNYVCEFTTSAAFVAAQDPTAYIPGSEPNNFNYILEFTSIKDIVVIVSLLFNVVFVSCLFVVVG
eukprot:TRINITY_DN21287_c0_g1_i1.p1 TRINITY_DN21287_c0_g1~~TRINITY_DN21287_c0_g1_i1.p1  ORF type:complete len:143 (+),score=21.03 TRINITY_DN21287_c0_g1_i1:16-444(+)